MTFTAPVLDAPAAEALARLACARAAGRPCAPVRTLLPAGDIGTSRRLPGYPTCLRQR
jgi:hypothetical protein